jgi:hypothetical protein
MRFMTLIKSKESTKIGPPPPELMQAIGQLGGEAAKAGVLADTAGLLPTSSAARVRLEEGRISTSDGPFAAGDEVVGAYAIFAVASKQEAVAWATRFMEVHKRHWNGWEGETEVRQLMEMPESGVGATRG